MNPVALFALILASLTAVSLWVQGNRYARRHVRLYGAPPRLTWMFRKAEDADLERSRTTALIILPFFLVSITVYLLRT